MKIEFVEAIFSKSPFGAKDLGEVPLMIPYTAWLTPLSTAINAYPLSSERVKAALSSRA